MSDNPVAEKFTLASLGQHLKQEREKAGLELREVSIKTRIAMELISSLEEGRQINMPGVYVRGFLRAYAEHLHLDAAAILDDFRRLTAGSNGSNVLNSRYVETDLSKENEGGLSLPLTLTLALLAVFAAALYLSPSLRLFLTERLPFLEQPTISAPAASPDQPQAPSPAPAEPFSGRLTLKADRTTWSQVSIDDEPLRHVLFEAGQSLTFEGRKSISIVAGDGQALRTEWNGQDHGPLGPAGPVEIFFPLVQAQPPEPGA